MLRKVVCILAFVAACDSSDVVDDDDGGKGDAGADGSIAGGTTSGTGNGDAGAGSGGTTSGSDAGAGGTTSGTGSKDAGGGGAGSDASTSSGDASASALDKFSFFVTSLASLRELSKSQSGFGGDLRFGESGEGAGLRGADKICTEIAELSMPGAAAKQWRAFLSTKSPAVSAKSRIGSGPWYDRTGRLVADSLTNLLKERPQGAATQIIDDLPNERGEPNQAGSAENGQTDNHDVVTASDEQGNFDNANTCSDWTSVTSSGSGPGLGHSWPAMSGKSWIAAHPAHGCAAGVYLTQTGPGTGTGIGAGGGYGAIYCFALTP
jgi:hypothetical protein